MSKTFPLCFPHNSYFAGSVYDKDNNILQQYFDINFLQIQIFIFIQISLNFIPWSPVNNISSLVHVKARADGKPLPVSMMTQFTNSSMQHRPRCVKGIANTCIFLLFSYKIYLRMEQFISVPLMLGEWRMFQNGAYGLILWVLCWFCITIVGCLRYYMRCVYFYQHFMGYWPVGLW